MVMIEINDETEDNIVCASLKKSYEYLCDDSYTNNMYNKNPYENYMQVEFLKEAIKKVYEYYSTEKLD
jgi:hypothetical protein